MNIKYMLLCTTLLTYGTTILSSDFQPPYGSRFIAPLGLPGSDISAVAAPFDPSESYTSQSIAPLGSPKPNNSKVSVLVQTEEIIDSTNNLPLKIHEELQSKYDALQQEHETLKETHQKSEEDFKSFDHDLMVKISAQIARKLAAGEAWQLRAVKAEEALLAAQQNRNHITAGGFLAGMISAHVLPQSAQTILAALTTLRFACDLMDV